MTRVHGFPRTSLWFGLLALLGLGVLLTGCGRKTFPQPMSQQAPIRIQDLEVQVNPRGVEVTFTMPERLTRPSRESGHRLAVLKSEMKWDNRNCLDCPTPFQVEAINVDAAFPSPAVVEKGKFSWVDTAVSPNQAYRYQVAILDRSGRNPFMSNSAVARVVPVPLPPSALSIIPDQNGILVQWRPQTKDEKGQALRADLQFILERHAPNKLWERVTPLAIKGNTFLDQTTSPEETYFYRVVPVLYFEETPVYGEASIIQQVKVPGALPPPPPGNVWVLPVKGALEIQWIESTGKISGYHVYRREGKEITRLTSSPVLKPPFVDKAVKKDTYYYYAVSAVGPEPEQREGLLSKWAEYRTLMME